MRSRILVPLIALAVAMPARGEEPDHEHEHEGQEPPAVDEPAPFARHAERLPSGVALPYPTRRVFRGFGPCIGKGRHRHEALDLGGVGPDSGVGTPVRSMVRSKVVMIGTGKKQPVDFGTPYKGKRPALRGGRKLPGSKEIPGYGKVYFFTSRRGKWRSGNIIELVGLEAPLAGARIRYMHLAAIRPDLEVGDILEAGDELGLLGGTGVQSAGPHVHIDVRGADGTPVDIAPLLGLPPSASCGDALEAAVETADGFVAATPTGPPPPERWPSGPTGDPSPPIELEPPPPPWRAPRTSGTDVGPATRVDIPDCGLFEKVGTTSADLRTRLWAGRWLELSLAGDTSSGSHPGLEIWDATAKTQILPGQESPVAVTELGKDRSAKLRLVIKVATEVAFVVRADGPWQLRIAERCKSPAAP